MRAFWVAVALGLVTALAAVGGNTPASADTGDPRRGDSAAVISDTGVSWQGRPLSFTDRVRWVPGDTVTDAFGIRNERTVPVTVELIARVAGDPEVTGQLNVRVLTADRRIELGPEPTRVTQVPAGQQLQVSVDTSLAPASGNESQLKQAQIDLVLLASGADPDPSGGGAGGASTGPGGTGPEPPGPAGSPGRRSGPLAGTGASIGLVPLLTAAALAALGTALLGVRNRRGGRES